MVIMGGEQPGPRQRPIPQDQLLIEPLIEIAHGSIAIRGEAPFGHARPEEILDLFDDAVENGTIGMKIGVLAMAQHEPLREQHLHQPFEVAARSEEHTSELQSLLSISYAVFC